jgi:hypothetical protein
MTSKFLEAKVIINKKSFDLLNTQMDIFVDYKSVISEEKYIKLNFSIDKVYGYFSYRNDTDLYKKETTINFNTDSSWETKLSDNINFSKLANTNDYVLLPESVVLDFDKKLVTINL